MKKTQLNKGLKKRVMFIESKGEPFDGAHGHIGWVTFSKSGSTVYYKDKVLEKAKRGISGNFFDTETGEEYWTSGIKKKGSNAHPYKAIKITIDEDAMDEYKKILDASDKDSP